MEAMSSLQWLLDVFIGAGLLWLAWLVLFSRDLFRGVVIFVSFGLLMAFAWVRLGALDVALAEAGIGAGLTGALLITALFRLQTIEEEPVIDSESADDTHGERPKAYEETEAQYD